MALFNEHIGVELCTWPSAPASPPPPVVQNSLMPGPSADAPNFLPLLLHLQRFLGRPASPQIVGSALAMRMPAFPCRHCTLLGHSGMGMSTQLLRGAGGSVPGLRRFRGQARAGMAQRRAYSSHQTHLDQLHPGSQPASLQASQRRRSVLANLRRRIIGSSRPPMAGFSSIKASLPRDRCWRHSAYGPSASGAACRRTSR